MYHISVVVSNFQIVTVRFSPNCLGKLLGRKEREELAVLTYRWHWEMNAKAVPSRVVRAIEAALSLHPGKRWPKLADFYYDPLAVDEGCCFPRATRSDIPR